MYLYFQNLIGESFKKLVDEQEIYKPKKQYGKNSSIF